MQVATSFIQELPRLGNNHDYYVVGKKAFLNSLRISDFPKNQFTFLMVQPSSIPFGLKMARQLAKHELEVKPDIVFSVFGPTYWKPKTLHVAGYAIPHYLYKESPFFRKIKFGKKMDILIKETVHKFLFKNNVDYYITETTDVANRLSRFLGVDRSNVFTVSNSYHQVFDDARNCDKFGFIRNDHRFKLLTVSSYYQHKNLDIIKQIIDLNLLSTDTVFVLTLDPSDFEKHFEGYNDQIINVGPTPINEVPCLYEVCDAMFLPTLLECFSASYPEAMISGLPILTSQLSFAESICGNAALYFDPMNPNDIIKTIKRLLNSPLLYKELQAKGENQLDKFETSTSRAIAYLEIIEKVHAAS